MKSIRKIKKKKEKSKINVQEAKITKVVEDNSAALERMKQVSVCCDKILQTFKNIEPQFKSFEPPPELEKEAIDNKIADYDELNKKPKQELVQIANCMNIVTKPSMSKEDIIKLIKDEQ